MPASVRQLLLACLLVVTTVNCARVSQRLVGGHAKVEPQATSKNTNNDDTAHEEKKTLSQQVAEGKYGLIQKELFEKAPKRLGVLSYEKNNDVPRDNENSLGGLGPDEIWLAEDHLLVLKGGSFHRTASELPWPPIDDYRAPNRQVKIPSQPKVPPPFPVQLAEGGPLQFFGINITRAANGSLTIPGPNGAPPIFLPLPGQDPADAPPGGAPFPLPPFFAQPGPENFPQGNGQQPKQPFPFPPLPQNNQSQLDEDDPSIYYPPPYSFFYPKDNTSKVPAGPLVPGIVLPPPPDFFGPLDTTTPSTTSSIATTVSSKKPQLHYLPYTTSSIKPIKPDITTEVPKNHHQQHHTIINIQEVPYDENELIHTTRPSVPTKPSTVPTYPTIITPKPFQPTTSSPPVSTFRTHPQQIFRLPYDSNYSHTPSSPKTRTRLRPTIPPPSTTPTTVYFSEDFRANQPSSNNNKNIPSRVMIPPLEPTVTNLPVIQLPKTYLRPTTVNPIVANSISQPQPIPVVQVSYGGGGGDRPRTYLKLKPHSSIANTVSPVPVLQVPYQDDTRTRTYLKPTSVPQRVQTSPISVQYLPYPNNQNGKTRVKPTPIPLQPQTLPTIPVVRIPSRTTQITSTSVPLKTYYSDVNTNSVQPQAEYYFYEEDSTAPPRVPQQVPQRLRYVAPTNFEKHIQQLRQKIQSYLKPSARPVYEYSFQAANYRPTKPPTRYLTPAPQHYNLPQEYGASRTSSASRYQQLQQFPQLQQLQQFQQLQQYNSRQRPNGGQDQDAYYTRQDERLLDDITKKYFTVFGQKITTPVTPASHPLSGDTIVNYREPRPPVHHQETEYIDIRPQGPRQQSPGEPGTFISYALPGEGAHFYFLTPQLVAQQRQQQQKQQESEEDNGYYYDKPENARRRRRNQR